MFLRPEEHPFCTAELIWERTFTGTSAELLDRLRTLRKAGSQPLFDYDQQGHPEMLEEWAGLFEKL
jgi:hypothetical protein